MSDAALDIVTTRVLSELHRERAAGSPFKAAYHAVARRLGISPRRVRAYHHREVPPEGVTAAEMLAADAAWRAQMDMLHARLTKLTEMIAHEAAAHPVGAVAPRHLDEAGHFRGGES